MVVPVVMIVVVSMIMIMIVPMIIAVIMPALQPAQSRGGEGLQMRPLDGQQPQFGAAIERTDRALHPARHLGAHPHDQPRIGHRPRLRGAQREIMGIRAPVQQQNRLAQIAHHHRHQRMGHGHFGNDRGDLRHGGRGGKKGNEAGAPQGCGVTHG